MRVAFDTNFLVYAEGVDDPVRQVIADRVIVEYSADETVIPVQVLGELFSVLRRKWRITSEDARRRVLAWRNASVAIDTTPQILEDAMQLVVSHQLAPWDAVILAAAASADCHILLSEDMHDGFTWRGVTLRNPFLAH
jgi:predicted nucleic acid-binding protein